MVFLLFTSTIPFRQRPEQKAEYGGRKTKVYNLPRKAVDLAGGPRLHLIVSTAYGKGVILKDVYEKMDGQFFAQFIRTHFNFTFARSGPKRHGKQLFIRDNDSSQRSKVAKRAFQDIEAELREIPPRSPDINVIESIFHLLRMDLEEEAVTENITCETFEQFRDRVLKSLERLPRDVIGRTIESLNDRIDTIICLRGSRTKYYRTFK